MAANFWVSSQYEEWTKGQSFDKLNEEDQKRVSERKRKDAEIFGPDSMEEDIKRLRVRLANTITCGCLQGHLLFPFARVTPAAAFTEVYRLSACPPS